MATRPFSYTPEILEIAGTSLFGDITVGTPTEGFTAYPGIKFWEGPEEPVGAIILALSNAVPAHTGADGEPSHIGFEKFENSEEFRIWMEQKIGESYDTADAANTAALLNGMWTNYVVDAGGGEGVYSYWQVQDCNEEVAPFNIKVLNSSVIETLINNTEHPYNRFKITEEEMIPAMAEGYVRIIKIQKLLNEEEQVLANTLTSDTERFNCDGQSYNS